MLCVFVSTCAIFAFIESLSFFSGFGQTYGVMCVRMLSQLDKVLLVRNALFLRFDWEIFFTRRPTLVVPFLILRTLFCLVLVKPLV